MLTLHGRLPDLSSVRWRAAATGPLPLRAREADLRPVHQDPARAFDDLVVRPFIAPLLGMAARADRLAPSLLRGNAASATVGAASMVVRSFPHAAGAVRSLVRGLLDTSLLRGTGTYEADRFHRRTCCLYYRLPGGGTCGDCPLSERR